MKIEKEILLTSYFDQALENLMKVLKIPSERAKSEKNAIFGLETRKALEFTINIAKEWGIKTHIDPEGFYGYFEYGTGHKTLLIAPHLDVVTPGRLSEWRIPPYQPTILGQKLFARGALDNKGPAYMILYAMKYLIDNKYNPNKFTIRVVFGVDEENEMLCLKKYLYDFGSPTIGFVPDGGFPCTIAEKAIADIDLKGAFECEFSIRQAKEKQNYNSVLDHVIYTGPKIPHIQWFLKANSIECEIIEKDKEEKELHVYGKSSHPVISEMGTNAALWLLKAMQSVKINHPLIQFFSEYEYFENPKKIPDLRDETGELSICVGYINTNKTHYKLGINFRIPATRFIQKDLIAKLEKVTNKFNITLQIKNHYGSLYFKEDQILVQKIMKVYQEHSNEKNLKPLATGISSYAKVIPNIIACGITKEKDGALSPHHPNEWASISDLKRGLLIYANLIVELTK